MAVAITGTNNVQSNTSSGTDKTLAFASDTYTAGEIVTVDVCQNDSAGFPTPSAPTNSGTAWTWNLTVDKQGVAGNFSRTTAYWALATAQTCTISQVTARGIAGTSALSTRGVKRRWTGCNTTTPIRASGTATFSSTTTDPLTSNTNLQIAGAKANDAVAASGTDWSASTPITTSFDSGLTRTEDINATEAGQATFISFYSSALGADDADVRAGMDAPTNGNWSAIFYCLASVAAAAGVGNAPPVPTWGPGSQGPLSWQWQQLTGQDGTTVSSDISVVAYLPVGMVPYADATHNASVTAHLPIGVVPYAPVGHDVSMVGHLPVGVLPYSPVTHDASVTAHLPVGVVAYAPALLTYPTFGYLPIGVLPYAPVGHDVPLVGHLPVGVVPYAPISHAASVVGHLPIGTALWAPVSHDASIVGHLPVGLVLYAPVSGASDVFVVGYLPVGVGLWAPVSHAASVAAHLPVGTDLRAPVTHTASVAGFLPVGVNLLADITRTATVVGYLPIGGVLYAIASAGGTIPDIVYPTAFEVAANWHLGMEIVPSNLTIELAASGLYVVLEGSGNTVALTDSNENLDLS